MHDVTEGGLATALEELSIACRRRVRVHVESIPVLKETAKLCRLLDLDPLGLIGSGSLLIICQRGASGDLERVIREAGVAVRSIGEMLEEGTGIEAIRGGEPADWPRFEVDELARLLAR
jgi:hydrogenase maturation factor